MTWHGTDGQTGAGEALVAFSGGTVGRRRAASGRRAARIENYLAELGRSTAASGRASCKRALHGLAVGDPWTKALVLVPRAGPGHDAGADAATRASAGCTSPASTPSYAFMGYMEGALESGAAAARRIAAKDGVVKASAA